jgi:acylphosphatase/outer membrane murein-binding lipoprotein Lpp
VQKVGYRKRIIDIARAFGLKGMIENLDDGRVKIIAEGDDEKLKWFEHAIEIKNTLIQVSNVEKAYNPAGGEFAKFGKLVDEGETDSRLDKGIEVMNSMLVAIKQVNTTLVDMNSNLGGKMDNLSGKMDNLSGKMDNLSGKMDEVNENLGSKIDQMDKNLGGKMDRMLQKQDEVLLEVKDIAQNGNELLVEVKDINRKIDTVRDNEIIEMKNDIAEVKAALRAKGII